MKVTVIGVSGPDMPDSTTTDIDNFWRASDSVDRIRFFKSAYL
ncbi:uncharacterized protein METZ01_LOCUS434135 [marine metagenome]|uniref:Uncharacterized protein n=1 Tax=marine metagenome TaxID=408172 RepID=A0A382YEF9_9ZZZZ